MLIGRAQFAAVAEIPLEDFQHFTQRRGTHRHAAVCLIPDRRAIPKSFRD